MVFYTVNIVYTCELLTFPTSYCLCDTLLNPWNVCIYVCVCMYVLCMYVYVLCITYVCKYTKYIVGFFALQNLGKKGIFTLTRRAKI